MTGAKTTSGPQVSKPESVESGRRLTSDRLALLASLAALGILATNIMLPAFPPIARDLGVSSRELASTLSIFFIVFAVGQLFVGPFADAMGRTPFVLGGLAVFVGGSVVCAMAPSLPLMIAGRAIQAVGACAASVLARAIARDLYNGPELTRALALVMIAMAAAPGFSPALGTAMMATFGWRSVFVLVALAGVFVALYYRLSVGETLPSDRRRSAHPLAAMRTYAQLATDARFVAPALTVSLVLGCLYSFFGAAPAILMTGMGVSAAGFSVFFAATVFVVFGSGLLTSPLARRFGATRVGMAGILMTLASGVWLVMQGGSRRNAVHGGDDSVPGRHGPYQSDRDRDCAGAIRRSRRCCVSVARVPANGMRRIGDHARRSYKSEPGQRICLHRRRIGDARGHDILGRTAIRDARRSGSSAVIGVAGYCGMRDSSFDRSSAIRSLARCLTLSLFSCPQAAMMSRPRGVRIGEA